MILVRQPVGSSQCGQACVAMVLGIGLDEAIELVGRKGLTRTVDLVRALRSRGVVCPLRLSSVRSPRAIVHLRIGAKGHWTIRWDEHVFDPELGIDHPVAVAAELNAIPGIRRGWNLPIDLSRMPRASSSQGETNSRKEP